MANTLTGLIPTLYQALNIVSREMVGFAMAVSRNSEGESAAVGQTISIPVVPAATAVDITPGGTSPDSGGQTIGKTDMTISKSKMVPVAWTGEEQRGVARHNNILRDQFAEAIRTLVNEVEADLGGLYVAASRAHGTAGTTPFGTANDLSDIAGVRQILEDNGAPTSDLQLVLGTAAMANIRGKQASLFKVNEAGTPEMLREGNLGRLEGFSVHSSGGVKAHTKGTGSGYLTNNVAGYGVGDTSIAVDTGTGTVLAGDIVTFAGDTDKYVNNTALTGGSIVIGKPGLRAALADGVAMTVGNNFRANMAFSRSAMHLITRAPAMPEGGDSADDVMNITDPISGITFQVALYRQYRQVHYEIGLAWGQKCTKSEHTIILIG